MGVECPKCNTENTSDSQFCKSCATPLPSSKDIPVTKTLETPTDKLTSGTTFASRYEIIEELGKGGMGRVYRVKDQKLDEEMALKVLKPEIAADKGMIERFKNELKLARKIAHKSICKMYDLNEEKDTPYITMEYVKGEDLKSFIRRKGKLSEEEAIAIAKQVCEGLEEAHELGVIHRDLKPQNIMIDEKSNAKVMDFGIARSVEAPGVTQTGVMIGTPDYISPEQAEGEEADQRSDIYALGVILYEMVTGSVPFKGDTAFSVALKHKTKLPSDPRKLNSEVSENLSRLILICMEKDRERRYQTAEALLSDLKNIEEGSPLGTKIRPRRETFVATLIRKKLSIPTLVIVAIAIIAVVIWRLLPQKEAVPLSPSDKPSIAIMYFENSTGDESLDHWRQAIPSLLITDLSQSRYIRVLSEERLYKILNQLNQPEAKTFSSDVLKQVGKEGGVEYILLGEYTRSGDSFRTDVRLQEADTSELIISLRAEAEGENNFFPMVDELTRKIKANFKLSQEQIASDIDREVGKITTSSPEAYRYYSEGRKYFQNGEYRKSIELMEKAIVADPEFAMAYRSIAVAYGIMGGYSSEVREYKQKSLELIDRLSDRERYLIQAYTERNQDKKIEAYLKVLELYPDDNIANNNLGVIYWGREQWDKALERFNMLIQKKDGRYLPYAWKAEVLMPMGMYDKARIVLEDYLNNIVDHASIRYDLAGIYLCQGKYDLALVEVNKAFSLDPAHLIIRTRGDIYHCKGDLVTAEKEYQKLLKEEEQGAQLWSRYSLGGLYLLQGRFEESSNQLKQGFELAEKIGERGWERNYHLDLAYLNLKSGNPEKALKECNDAWNIAVKGSLWSKINTLHPKGLAYLGMKSINEAQRVADELKELIEKGMIRKSIRFYYHLIGMIELEKENFSKAIDYFKKAISFVPFQYFPWPWLVKQDNALFINSLALAYYRAGHLEKSSEEFERMTSLSLGRLYYGDIYAKSFYMLGKIYEQKGWKGKAIENYEKFLQLWKDADPGIAEVEDARKRLAGLMRK